jgi:hypothetical protein
MADRSVSEGACEVSERNEVVQDVGGFGLPRDLEAVPSTDALILGATGLLYEENGKWRWRVESGNPIESRERAQKEMRAAMDGAAIIEGLDALGHPVERRTGKGYGKEGA